MAKQYYYILETDSESLHNALDRAFETLNAMKQEDRSIEFISTEIYGFMVFHVILTYSFIESNANDEKPEPPRPRYIGDPSTWTLVHPLSSGA